MSVFTMMVNTDIGIKNNKIPFIKLFEQTFSMVVVIVL